MKGFLKLKSRIDLSSARWFRLNYKYYLLNSINYRLRLRASVNIKETNSMFLTVGKSSGKGKIEKFRENWETFDYKIFCR